MQSINALNLFDGMSCGLVALKRLGVTPLNYYASEVDKPAMKISQKNNPEIKQLGDVRKVKGMFVDLFMGGSPCQGFSIAGNGLNFDHPQSILFFQYVRILNECLQINPELEFLLENVSMPQKWVGVITKILGVEPIKINSALVSGQNRVRIYWTNIKGITQPEDKSIQFCDILQFDVDDKYYHTEAAINYMNRSVKGGRNHWDFAHHSDTNKGKSACVTANFIKGVPYNVLIDRREPRNINPFKGCSTNQPKMQHRIWDTQTKSPALTSFSGRTAIYPDPENLIRRLTPIECERLQTLPDNYTEGVSDSQRYKMLGNGWNVDTIVHILSFAKFNK